VLSLLYAQIQWLVEPPIREAKGKRHCKNKSTAPHDETQKEQDKETLHMDAISLCTGSSLAHDGMLLDPVPTHPNPQE